MKKLLFNFHKKTFLILIFFMISLNSYAQILTESNLPIIKINTGGVNGSYIPDEPKIPIFT